MKRTDDQIFTKAPIELTLGEGKYEAKTLTVGKAFAWRQKLHKKMEPILAGFGTQAGAAALSGGLTMALLNFPDVICELVFEYAPNIPKTVVLDEDNGATDEQMAKAFSQIMEVAYPYLAQLAMVKTALQAAVSQQ